MVKTGNFNQKPATDVDHDSDEVQEDTEHSESGSDVSDEAVGPVSDDDGLFGDDSNMDLAQAANRMSLQK